MAEHLTRKRRRVTKAIHLMTDPDPQFVSLVSNGANQTPFKAVKTDGTGGDNEVVVAGVRTTDIDKPSEDIMSKKAQAGKTTTAKKMVVRTAASDGPDLHKLTFASANFTDEQAVRSYLDANGYEGGDIAAVDGGYEVTARAVEDFESVESITGEDGVTRHVGTVKEPETTEDETVTKTDLSKPDDEQDEVPADDAPADEPASTDTTEDDTGTEQVARAFADVAPVLATKVDAELVKRYDGWMANYSNGTTIQEVMSAGADGLPPGIYELNDAFYTALRNTLLANESANVAKLVAEFGQLITVLVNSMSFATIPAEVAQKMLGGDGKEQTQKSDKSTGEIDMDELAKKAAELVLSQLSEQGVTSDALQQVSKTAGKTTDELKQQVEDLSKQLAEQTKKSDETVAELSQKVDTLSGRANRLEKVSVVSRALDLDNPPSSTESETTRKSSNTVDSSLRNELGFG